MRSQPSIASWGSAPEGDHPPEAKPKGRAGSAMRIRADPARSAGQATRRKDGETDFLLAGERGQRPLSPSGKRTSARASGAPVNRKCAARGNCTKSGSPKLSGAEGSDSAARSLRRCWRRARERLRRRATSPLGTGPGASCEDLSLGTRDKRLPLVGNGRFLCRPPLVYRGVVVVRYARTLRSLSKSRKCPECPISGSCRSGLGGLESHPLL
jgi:hypothetical protein